MTLEELKCSLKNIGYELNEDEQSLSFGIVLDNRYCVLWCSTTLVDGNLKICISFGHRDGHDGGRSILFYKIPLETVNEAYVRNVVKYWVDKDILWYRKKIREFALSSFRAHI